MNRHCWPLFLSLCWLVPVSLGHASETAVSTASLRLSELLEEARRHNPELRAARARWDAARARVRQAATPEKPRLDFERMYAPRGENPFTEAEEKSVVVRQEFPFPTALLYRGRAARKEAEAAQARYEAKERDVLSRVKNAYAMIFLNHHSIHIFESNVALMRQFSRAVESKYAVRKASQGDVLKAQVELSRTLNRLVTLEQELETHRALMNALLDRAPESPLGSPEEHSHVTLVETLDHLTSFALNNRPEVKEARSDLDRADALVAAARSEIAPDVMLEYRRREMTNGPDSHDATVGLSVPLWFWKQAGMVSEAQAERRMAEAEFAAMNNMTRLDAKTLYAKVQTSARLVDLYRSSVLPQAEQALKVAEAGYQSDQTDFLDLLDAARTLLDFRLEHYEHLAEFQALTAELERVIGADLNQETHP